MREAGNFQIAAVAASYNCHNGGGVVASNSPRAATPFPLPWNVPEIEFP